VKVRLLSRCGGRPIFSAALGNVGFATDDWLDTARFHRVVKSDRAKHVAVVGHRTRRHPEFFDAFGERLDLNSAVEEAVIGMKMKVDEVWVRHRNNEMYNAAAWKQPKPD